MSWLLASRSLVITKTIQCPLSKALAFLHDHESHIRLSDLVVSVKRTMNNGNISKYTVVDKIVLLGPFSTQVSIDMVFEKVENGCVVDTTTALRTRIKHYWSVRQADSGEGVEIIERVNIQTIAPFLPMTVNTLRSSHIAMLEKLAAQLEGRQAVRDDDSASNRQIYIDGIRVLLPFVIGYFILKTFTGSLLVGGITYALNLFSGKTKDPYGSFHVSLNASSNSSSATSSQTEWLNMGYWKDTDIFTTACRALALKVAQAARLGTASKSSRVLDVGHGTGESLLFLLTDPSIIRPQSIIGITSLEAHHQRSRERVDKVLNTLPGTQPDVELYHGDAVFRPEENRTDHPLNPKSSSPPFTAILALDCAYHFNTREEFLRQSHLRLARSGRVALADICFVAGSTSRLYTTVLLTMLGVPRANAITVEEYRRAMESAGFVDIEVEDISDHVFPGFSQFLRTQGGAWWLFGTAIAALGRSGARYLIISGAKRVV